MLLPRYVSRQFKASEILISQWLSVEFQESDSFQMSL